MRIMPRTSHADWKMARCLMRDRLVLFAVTAVVTVTAAVMGGVMTTRAMSPELPMAALTPRRAAVPPLDSLYLVRSFFSDNLSDGYTEVLDVTPVGEDTRLRVMRISLASPYCPNKLVRAAETIVKRRSIKDVVSADPCALEPAVVEEALKAAAPREAYAFWHDASHTMVARCGAQERVFNFPYTIKIDYKKLQRSNPRVADLWDVCYRMPARALPGGTPMNDERPDVQRALEALGDKLLPELISGKYQTAFNSDSLLGYKGAPPPDERGLLPPALVASNYLWTRYVTPERTSLILSTRLSGMVHLRIQAEPTTGNVTNVEAVKGQPLLAAEAVRAARLWQLKPFSFTGLPLDVHLNFSLDCRP
jgi:hypothetical protein